MPCPFELGMDRRRADDCVYRLNEKMRQGDDCGFEFHVAEKDEERDSAQITWQLTRSRKPR